MKIPFYVPLSAAPRSTSILQLLTLCMALMFSPPRPMIMPVALNGILISTYV